MKKVLIVDDHDVVRDGVKSIFIQQGEPATFLEASSVPEALKLAGEGSFDVAVVDLSLGGQSGLELLKELKLIQPKLPVLVLSMHAEEHYAQRAFKAGAAGYITKDTSRAELANALHRVMAGGRYVSAGLAEKLAFDLKRDTDKPLHETLSDREFEVMCLIASGKTVGQIAEQLLLSDKTVSTYRARILEKMAMKNNAELTHYAIRNKLV